MINLDNQHLLMIEPTSTKVEKEFLDRYTRIAFRIYCDLMVAKDDPAKRYRGFHICACGARSDNRHHIFDGMETNSLIFHYLRYHRSEVPVSELDKLDAIAKKYNWV